MIVACTGPIELVPPLQFNDLIKNWYVVQDCKESIVILQSLRFAQVVLLFGIMHTPVQLPCRGAGDTVISKFSVDGVSTNGRAQ